MQWEAQKQVHARFYGSKAQLAFKADFESGKQEKRQLRQKAKVNHKQRQFEIRQSKKKQKHRGH